jgi:hypothetical protein
LFDMRFEIYRPFILPRKSSYPAKHTLLKTTHIGQKTVSKQDDWRMDTQLHKKVEADLDANYHRIPVPHSNKAIAIWYLLTVLEDNLRGLFVLSDDSDASIVEFQIDRQKYSARFALDRIRNECVDIRHTTLPTRVVPKVYVKTGELLHAGVDFMGATQLCSAAHTGSVIFKENDESIDIVFDETQEDPRYAALELLGHMPPGLIDHSANLYFWTRRKDLRPSVINSIAQSVRIVRQQVIYEYLPSFAIALAQEMMQPPSLIPDGWRFPWGGRYETTLLINAMCVRCMYHWVAVHFGATFKGLPGGGEASLLYVTTKSQLILDLQKMCSLGEIPIHSFVQYLSYGYAMKTPDPALQPIIAMSNGQIGIPCLLFLSSNYERNLLGLQTRIDSASFDAMSKLFENSMVQNLLQEISSRWPMAKGNVTIRMDSEFEEIDLLIADSDSRTLLVCELRWMLQPGDPREVHNRKKVCREKVDQLARKVQWLRPRVGAALSVLGIKDLNAEQWQIEGVVAIQTFGGTLSNEEKFPIMTARLLTQGLMNASSLKHFADWSQSLCWLPKEGLHFSILPQEVHLSALKKHLNFLGMKKLCSLGIYTKFVKESLA